MRHAFSPVSKTKAGIIGVNQNVNRSDCTTLPGNTLASITEIVTDTGKETDIVSSARNTPANPASAYAKTVDRSFEASVAEGCDTQTDIAMGGGNRLRYQQLFPSPRSRG